VGIQIYTLTRIGKAMARSIKSPDSSSWKVIHFLDGVGSATREQISEYCGLGTGEASSVLLKLRYKHIIAEQTGTEA
jgi:hypothetical protein